MRNQMMKQIFSFFSFFFIIQNFSSHKRERYFSHGENWVSEIPLLTESLVYCSPPGLIKLLFLRAGRMTEQTSDANRKEIMNCPRVSHRSESRYRRP